MNPESSSFVYLTVHCTAASRVQGSSRRTFSMLSPWLDFDSMDLIIGVVREIQLSRYRTTHITVRDLPLQGSDVRTKSTQECAMF